jgi:DNA polymerase-3 subunit gamma/tau
MTGREFHLSQRPTTFGEVVGQPRAVAQLTQMGRDDRRPHLLLFVGPSGCGKTTLARIVRRKLRCGEADFMEVNAANNRGIDMVRDIEQRIGLAPIDGDCRVWLIDEAHALTPDAQGAFLKILEEPPSHVYFMLATTDPQKLKPTIRTRATEIVVYPVPPDDLAGLCLRTVPTIP